MENLQRAGTGASLNTLFHNSCYGYVPLPISRFQVSLALLASSWISQAFELDSVDSYLSNLGLIVGKGTWKSVDIIEDIAGERGQLQMYLLLENW